MAENRSTQYGQGGQPLSLRGAMDRLFQDAFVPSLGAGGFEGGQFSPAVDIRDADDSFVVVASLPGVKRDDVDITLENNTLSIRGEIKDESESEQGEYIYRERRVGRFSRQIQFPSRVDAEGAEASFEDGTLRLRIPKARETQPRRIEIKAGGKGSSGGKTPAK